MESPLRALFRLVAYGSWTVVVIPLQALALLLRLRLAKTLPVFYHGVCLRILGVDVVVKGEMLKSPPVLFAANHTSYLDISILGALIPGSFIAKSEVADWPFFGLLAKLQRTVFVDRHSRFIATQHREMGRRLDNGDNLVLFPEGTSSDGNRVLPFKSALFGVAQIEIDGRALPVQPVSVTYAMLDAMPMGRHLRPYYAWYGDMDLASHIWKMAGLGRLTVVVEFHQPLTIADAGSRKALARRCEAHVSAGVAAALTGRPQTPRLKEVA